MTDDDDPEIFDIIDEGLQELGTVDARIMALQQSVFKYPECPYVAVGALKEILDDAIELLEVWDALRQTRFGMMFDPRVIKPEEDV